MLHGLVHIMTLSFAFICNRTEHECAENGQLKGALCNVIPCVMGPLGTFFSSYFVMRTFRAISNDIPFCVATSKFHIFSNLSNKINFSHAHKKGGKFALAKA